MNGFRNWILEKLKYSDIALFKKIAKSLERDMEIPMRFIIWRGIIYLFAMLTGRFNLRRCNKVGKRPRTRHRPYIENMGQIIIGDDVNINSRNVQTDLVSGPNGVLRIGNEVSINFGVSIVANKNVTIGNRVRIAPYTMIYDSNMHVHGDRYARAEGDPVIIEDDVWLTSRVMVLKGSRIGKGSLIAAGSIVSGVIPPYVIAAGTPARVIKYINPPDNSGFMWEQSNGGKQLDDSIITRVKKVASEIFTVDLNTISVNHTHNMISNWDSFRHVKFIRALESEFNISFEKKDWSRFTNIGKICGIIQQRVKKNSVYKKHTG